MATFLEALRFKNQVSNALLQLPEVVGVGIGFANNKKGAALHVYTKRTTSQGAATTLVRTTIGSNFPTKIIQSGIFNTNKTIGANKTKLIKISSKRSDPNYSRYKIRPVPGEAALDHSQRGLGHVG